MDELLNNSRILIIDDVPATVEPISNALRELGCIIELANNGLTGIDMARQNPPELILCDVKMPAFNGYKTCRVLRSDSLTRDIPLIFMTGGDRLEAMTEGFESGAIDFIAKPFLIMEVIARVRVQLELSHHRSQLKDRVNRQERFLSLSRVSMDSMKTAIIWGDPEHDTVEYSNRAARNLLGVTKTELHARRFSDAIPGFKNRTKENLREQAEFGHARFEAEATGKRGRIRPIEVTINHVCPAEKDHYFVFLEDISDRKKAEQALRQSETHFRTTVRKSPLGMATISCDLRFLMVNENFCRLVGLNEEELIGYPVDRIYGKDEPGTEVKQSRDIMRGTNSHFTLERQFTNCEGNQLWFELTATLVNADDEPAYGLWMLKDITERKTATLELQEHRDHLEEKVASRTEEIAESNRLLRQEVEERAQVELLNKKLISAIERSPLSVMITDADGKIQYVNPYFTELTGFTSIEAIGHTPRILRSELTTTETYQEMWSTIQSGNVWRGDLANRKKSGELFWESASIAPILDDGGSILHFVGVKEDITERKKAEQELVSRHEAAEVAARMKSSFLTSISHELRTPMNAILGFSQLLMRENDFEGPQQGYIQNIIDSGEHLLKMINEILEMSKIKSGHVILNEGALNLSKLLLDLKSEHQAMCDTKQINLSIDFDSGLPTGIKGDEWKLGKILINLLANAIKFTASGGNICIIAAPSEGDEGITRLQITIQDTGVGISRNRLRKIFNSFDDSRTTSETGGHAGLGLAISREYAQLMKGSISAVSELGVGSSFTLEIPLVAARESELRSPPPKPTQAFGTESRKPLETYAPDTSLMSTKTPFTPTKVSQLLMSDEEKVHAPVTAIPLELRASMIQAARRAAYFDLEHLIDKVDLPRAAAKLRRLVRDFEYEALIDLLSEPANDALPTVEGEPS